MPTDKMVIFDLDGTLLNTLDDLFAAVDYMIRRLEFPLRTLEDVKCSVGNGISRLVELSVPNGRQNCRFGEAVDIFKNFYNAHSAEKTKPYSGITELLRVLNSQGIPCAVVSNKSDETVNALCKRYFGELIAYSVGERHGVSRKPHPDSVLEVIRHFECDNAIYVGDSEVDILTAANAKLPCVSVTWGFREKAFLEANGASLLASNVRELYAYICALLKAEENAEFLRDSKI